LYKKLCSIIQHQIIYKINKIMLNVIKCNLMSFFHNDTKIYFFEILSSVARYSASGFHKIHKKRNLFHFLSYCLPEYQNRSEKSFFVQTRHPNENLAFHLILVLIRIRVYNLNSRFRICKAICILY